MSPYIYENNIHSMSLQSYKIIFLYICEMNKEKDFRLLTLVLKSWMEEAPRYYYSFLIVVPKPTCKAPIGFG